MDDKSIGWASSTSEFIRGFPFNLGSIHKWVMLPMDGNNAHGPWFTLAIFENLGGFFFIRSFSLSYIIIIIIIIYGLFFFESSCDVK
jgi:hypothetical protein